MRVKEFDMMRGAGVFMVLGRHSPAIYELGWVGHLVYMTGWTALHMFFVLSGYLVTGLLLAEHERHGEVRVMRFLVRRGMKIYPQFYLLLGISFFGPWIAGYEMPWGRYLAEALFVQNYFPGYWVHTWSLAVEEHFYLGVAFVVGLWVLGMKRGRWGAWMLPATFVLVIAVATVLRFRQVLGGDYVHGPVFLDNLTHFQMDALASGSLLCWFVRRKGERLPAFARRWKWLLVALAVASFAPLAFFHRGEEWVFLWGYPLASITFCALLLVFIYNPIPEAGPVFRWLKKPFATLAAIGRHSYGIYLWHMPVSYLAMPIVVEWLSPGAAMELAWFYVLGIAVGVASGKLVEMPALRLRERIAPSRSGPDSATVAQAIRVAEEETS